MNWLTAVKNEGVMWWHIVSLLKIFMKIKTDSEFEKVLTKMIFYFMYFLSTFRHWLATYFVTRYGVPYMTYDIFAMYLSHYHRFRVKGHEDYKGHSLRTISSFVRREFLLVLHHIALLTILLPVTLVRNGRQVGFQGRSVDDGGASPSALTLASHSFFLFPKLCASLCSIISVRCRFDLRSVSWSLHI